MKKFLSITAAILVLLFVVFWGYIKYQRHLSYQTPIPANTRALIRVDVFDICKSIAGEYLGKKRNKKTPSLKGIGLPADFFLFTVQGKHPTTLFGILPLNDSAAFGKSLRSLYPAFVSHNNTPGLTLLSNGAATIAYNNAYVVFAYSPRKEQVDAELTDLLQLKNTVLVGESTFKQIREEEGHITYLSGADKGSIDFNKGSIRLEMQCAAVLPAPASQGHIYRSSNEALGLWLYADLGPLLAKQTFRVDTFNVSGDSLLRYAPKGLYLSIGPSVSQKDTVITYDYNDDFEKVATTSISETKVPQITLRLDADATGLYSYLQRNHFIGDSGRVTRSVFPLYRLYAGATGTQLLLSTGHEISSAPAETVSDFAGLDIDFSLLRQQEAFAPLRRYMRLFKYLEARASAEHGKQYKIQATLSLNNDDRNALLQLLDSF